MSDGFPEPSTKESQFAEVVFKIYGENYLGKFWQLNFTMDTKETMSHEEVA